MLARIPYWARVLRLLIIQWKALLQEQSTLNAFSSGKPDYGEKFDNQDESFQRLTFVSNGIDVLNSSASYFKSQDARNGSQRKANRTIIDDAIGEAYDETARWLGLNMGRGDGPALEELAREGDAHSIKFSRPMQQHKDCNFS